MSSSLPITRRAVRFQDQERAHFDQLAQTTGHIWWGSTTEAGAVRLQRRATMLALWLRQRHAPEVLEVGCGTGALTVPLLRQRPDLRLTACDISPRSVEVAARRCAQFKNASFHVVDVLDEPYKGESFDAVVGNAVLHHLRIDLYLPKLFHILRPGGVVGFFEPNMLNPQVALEKNVRLIGRWLQNTPDETAFVRWRLHRQLAKAGFVDVSVSPFDFLHPAAPKVLINVVHKVGALFENVPGLREFSGSLVVRARRPPTEPTGAL